MTMDDVGEYWRRVFHFSPLTVWFNITGQPAIMQLIGANADGLPVAVQAVGPTTTRQHASDFSPS